MWYSFIFGIGAVVLRIINGKMTVLNKDRLPEGNYILIAPHRTWFDMIFIAVALRPKQLCFMAKKELFKNRFVAWVIHRCNGFSVNREHPGMSAVKTPVNYLRKTNLSLMMFPSGTRHSSSLKAGAAFIAQVSKVPMVPVVYQGPMTLKDVFLRHKVKINFGDPIYVNKKGRLTDDEQKKVEDQMQEAFNWLDDEINPSFVYVDESIPARKARLKQEKEKRKAAKKLAHNAKK